MTKTITMTLEEYNNDLTAARKEGEVSSKYAPLIELVREITAWQANSVGSFSSFDSVAFRHSYRINNWSGEEIESKLRNLMHKIDGYS